MAQIKFRADITTAEFPLLSEWAGRTIVQNPGDSQPPPPVTTPQILYCENVLPTQQGMKSVSFKDLIAAVAGQIYFSNIFPVADAAQNRALIGVTTDSKIFMLTNAAPTWVDVTPSGWAGGDKVTTGSANGVSYLYLQQKGCYLVNITGVVLTLTTLTAITAGNIYGMISAVNYLVLWDKTTIYWSSTINPLDFTPSLITGAGSSVPFDESGQILICVQLNNGFCIYTNSNAVLASYSNNAQFPWIFRNANNVAGISDYKQVNEATGLGFHVALTAVGVTQVTPSGGEVIAPELSDFLAARVCESYDTLTKSLINTELSTALKTSIAVIGARWIVMSYGVTTDYSDALVYDLTLKRWGKFHISHVRCFELDVNLEGTITTYADLLGQTYASRSPTPYYATVVSINNAPALGRVFGFLQKDGTLKSAFLDFTAESSGDLGLLLLGKYQLTRNYFLELQGIEVESIPSVNTGFNIEVLTSLNGKDFANGVVPTVVENGDEVRVYAIRAIGKNHILAFKGSFNLTSVEITALMGGRR